MNRLKTYTLLTLAMLLFCLVSCDSPFFPWPNFGALGLLAGGAWKAGAFEDSHGFRG
jgi:hypothetical protein